MSEYKITEEIRDIFDESSACANLSERCIDLFFFTRKAITLKKKSIKLNRKGWNLVFDLHPELQGKDLEVTKLKPYYVQIKSDI